MNSKRKTKSVVVLGASTKEQRYANKAIKALRNDEYEVFGIGREKGATVVDVMIYDSFEVIPEVELIHTVTIYLSERNQKVYEEEILKLKPHRVIFNPGAENRSFYALLIDNGIEAINACTLVMLSLKDF